VRSVEVRFARLEEIEGSTWVIPGERMKSGASDRVLRSEEALAVVAQAMRYSRDGYLFPSVRKGVVCDATMSRITERRGMVERDAPTRGRDDQMLDEIPPKFRADGPFRSSCNCIPRASRFPVDVLRSCPSVR
jgi:integrase